MKQVKFYRYKVELVVPATTKQEGKEKIEQQLSGFIAKWSIKAISQKRTAKQNRALHKYFTLVAEHCNERGLTISDLIIKPTEYRITRHILKDFFRELGRRMFGKNSTAKLTTEEMSKTIEVCEQAWAERLDYTQNFPSKEELIL